MTVTKNYADHVTLFRCDECGDTFEADGLDFGDAYDEYKEHGGVARFEGSEWQHRCQDCA